MFNVIGVFGRGIPMEAQAREGAQFDAGGQCPPQKSAGVFQSLQDFGAAYGAFNGRNIDVGEGQFTVYLGIRDEDLVQARVADLTDEQFRELLADAIRNTLKPDGGWHALLIVRTYSDSVFSNRKHSTTSAT